MAVFTFTIVLLCVGQMYGRNAQHKLTRLQQDVDLLRDLSIELKLDIESLNSWRNTTFTSPHATDVIDSDSRLGDCGLHQSFEQSLDAMERRVSYIIKGLEDEKLALREMTDDIRAEVRKDIVKIQIIVDNVVNESGEIRRLANNNKKAQSELLSNITGILAEVRQDIANIQISVDSTVKETDEISARVDNNNVTQREIFSSLIAKIDKVDTRVTTEMEKSEIQLKAEKSETIEALRQINAKLNQHIQTITELINADTKEQLTRMPNIKQINQLVKLYHITMKQDGWLQYKDYLYKLFTTAATFSSAVKSCEDNDASLVEVRDSGEIEFLFDNFGTHQFWLGATDQQTEGEWRWLTGQLMEDSNWAPSQPDDWKGGEDCLMTGGSRLNSTYNDAFCTNNLSYVCKRQ